MTGPRSFLGSKIPQYQIGGGVLQSQTGVPPKDRTANGVLDAWWAVCLLRSCHKLLVPNESTSLVTTFLCKDLLIF